MEMVTIPVFVSVRLNSEGKNYFTAWSCKMDGSGLHHVLETEVKFPASLVPDLREKEVTRLWKEIQDKRATCEMECTRLEQQINNLLAIEMEPRP